MGATNIHFAMAEKSRGVCCGGIGAIHLMVQKLGLPKDLDQRLHLLKRHLPYQESDHVLSLAYNALLDGLRLFRESSGWRLSLPRKKRMRVR